VIQLWTDGCCWKNPHGVGGWAYVAVANGKVIASESGGSESTTNNIMEITAIIRAIEDFASVPGKIEIVSDSKYVVDGANSWRHNWKKNGWRRKVGRRFKPVLNIELWKKLDELLDARPDIVLRWVKGHAGKEFNELADAMANQGAERVGQPV
jgi:ribonuclease HI